MSVHDFRTCRVHKSPAPCQQGSRDFRPFLPSRIAAGNATIPAPGFLLLASYFPSSSCAMSSRAIMRHISARPSELAVTTRRPSCEKVAVQTGPEWPSSLAIVAPAAAFQIRAV